MKVTIERYSKDRHDKAEVKNLLALAVGHPTLDKLAYLIDQFYASTGRTMYIHSRKGSITGVIGVEYTGSSYGFITHLAVHPTLRKKGIGERLIKHVTETLGLDEVIAETDQAAVGFYDACGFETRQIDSPCLAVSRFRCIKNIKRGIE